MRGFVETSEFGVAEATLERIADLEGARASIVVPGGQAAIALVYLAFCQSGSHALVPESAYWPNRELADKLLAGLGIRVATYDPLVGAEIARLIRPNTSLIWCESPGSITMEGTMRKCVVPATA